MRKLLLSLSGLLTAIALGCAALAQAPGTNSNFSAVWTLPYQGIQRTYSQAMANLVVASSATTWWQLCGTASATVHVTRITIAGRATAAASADIQLIKTSTAATGGTIASGQPFNSAAIVGVPYDTTDAAGTALVTAWTANPTVGTPVVASAGWVWSGQAFLGNLTTGQPGIPTVINFADHPGKAIVLRGAAQCLAISSAVGTGPGSGNLMDVTEEWTEE
jgi:hypothetical protein